MTCNCGKPTRDACYVCDDCLGELARALGEIPWLLEQLEITLQKARGIDYTALGGAASSEVALPLDVRAMDASRGLRQVMVMWVRFCDEESIRHQSPMVGLPEPDEGDEISLVAMSRWLLWRVDGLGLNDLGWDAVSELTRAIGKCRMVIDRPAEKQYAGPCECGRDLYAKPKAKMVQCRSCEREYDVEEMGTWMRAELGDRLFTAREATTLLGRFALPTAKRTIDHWHERGRVTAHGTNPAGHHLYRLNDLVALAAQGGRMSA